MERLREFLGLDESAAATPAAASPPDDNAQPEAAGDRLALPEDYDERIRWSKFEDVDESCKCHGAHYVKMRMSDGTLGLVPCPWCAHRPRDEILRAMQVDPDKTFAAWKPGANDATLLKAKDALAELLRGERWCVHIRARVGCGKTHLAQAALIEWIEITGRSDAWFVVVPDLIDELRATYDPESNVQTSLDSLMQFYRERVGFLVLDDLGAQRPKDFADEKLYQIIDYRERHRKATVVTSNIEPGSNDELVYIDERILSRLSGGEIICADAVDVRREFSR